MTGSTNPLIEIRDPALDGEAISLRVQQQAAQRQSQGAYGQDPATLGPEELRPERYGTLSSMDPAGFPSLQASLIELIAQGNLREPTFSSDAPLVGPIIVMIRRFWNWMSTKWYVRPVLQQQTAVNARTASIINDLVQWHELDAQRLQQLESRLAELEARLPSENATGDS
jgi:hypothetical protein